MIDDWPRWGTMAAACKLIEKMKLPPRLRRKYRSRLFGNWRNFSLLRPRHLRNRCKGRRRIVFPFVFAKIRLRVRQAVRFRAGNEAILCNFKFERVKFFFAGQVCNWFVFACPFDKFLECPPVLRRRPCQIAYKVRFDASEDMSQKQFRAQSGAINALAVEILRRPIEQFLYCRGYHKLELRQM